MASDLTPYREMDRWDESTPADRCRERAHEAIVGKLRDRVTTFLEYINRQAGYGYYEAKLGFGYAGDHNLNQQMAQDTAVALQEMGFRVEVNYTYDGHPAWRRWFNVPDDDYHYWLRVTW